MLAMLTTLFSVILILTGTIVDFPLCSSHALSQKVDIGTIALSLGTFMFGFGGHAVFPTIQHDMRHPNHFTRSAVLAFCSKLARTIFLFCIYLDK